MEFVSWTEVFPRVVGELEFRFLGHKVELLKRPEDSDDCFVRGLFVDDEDVGITIPLEPMGRLASLLGKEPAISELVNAISTSVQSHLKQKG